MAIAGTRLNVLRSQLASLRRARASARQLSAWAAVGTAVVWSLVGLFLLDWFFQREVQATQRVILMLIAAGVVAWAFYKYARSLLAVHETDVDMAIMVERQQGIESDLVAAIQFEDDVEGRWGSRDLEVAVIDYVAHVGRDIDVFQGFNRDQMRRRATILGVSLVLVLAAALIFPRHAAAFVNRLLLGSAHYPSQTQIEALAVNGRNVLTHGMQPENLRCAEGRQVEFLLRCQGRLPEAGLVRLVTSSGTGLGGLVSRQSTQRTDVELKQLTPEERLARLQTAQQKVVEARQSMEIDLAGPWIEEVASLVRYEAPREWNALELEASSSASQLGDKVREKLPEIEKLLAELTANGVEGLKSNNVALYVGGLPRLNEPVTYRVSLGDAYTDPAEVSMIALPAVEAKLTPIPPKYAAKTIAADQAGRQAAVLVSSEVKVAIECTNNKPLKEAWIIVRPASGAQAKRFDLKSENAERTVWSLANKIDTPFGSIDSPFNNIQEELRYEIQVTDDDGLHLETPIKGSVRIRTDKPPVAIASTVHRVVLPTAKPSIQYRVGDDFGIKRLQLVVEVERQPSPASANSAASETMSPDETMATGTDPGGEKADVEETTVDLLTSGPLTIERLPLASKASVNLAGLRLNPSLGPLQKGDRLKVVLLAEDYRGDAQGETFRSEPIIIEVSDEFGVASAVSEADPQAEQRVTEIIKRQLGIGESP